MATIHITDDHVQIRLSPFERLAGLTGHHTIPLDGISDITVEHDPLPAIRGLRAPGLAVPGRTRIGTWRRPGERTFVCVRGGLPAVRIRTVERGRFDAYLVSHHDATAIAADISARRTRG